jgi:hypothetical protein
MSDEGRGRELSHRVRDMPEGGPAQSTAPALSEEMRQRMQAAVKAERGVAKGPNSGINGSKSGRVTRHSPAGNSRPKAAERKGRGRPSDGNTRTGTAIQPPPGHPPAQPDPPTSRRRKARLGAMAAALVLVLVLGVVLTRVIGSGDGNQGVATQSQESGLRTQAATWVTQEVSPGTSVSCDQAMCAALRADSFGGKLVVLGPASPEPPDSTLVVITPAVQALYGTSLSAAWAPSVLASFGSGPAEVSVRMIAPHGVGSYAAQARKELANRISFGTALLNLNRITLSPSAQQQLTTGQVDQRLVIALAALAATREPIDILDFANNGPGESGDVPLRYADLAATDSSAGLAQGPYVRAMHDFLDSSGVPVPTTSSVLTQPDGQVIFRVAVEAPTPAGQLSQQLP